MRKIFVVGVQAEDALGAAPLHLHGVETGIAADIEHGLAFEAVRDDSGEASPFHVGIVAKKV
ncbi:hypothetical protein ACVWWO_006686 [Bradyrhizobium sp. F1.13.1]